MGHTLKQSPILFFTFLQRFFYATHDFTTPLVAAGVVSAVDVLLSLWLRTTPLRVRGLAIANSIAFTAGFLHLLLVARKRLGTLDARAIASTGLRLALSLLPFAGFLLAFHRLTRTLWRTGSTAANLGVLVAGVAAAVAILLAMFWLTKIEILRDVIRRRRGVNA